MTDVIVRATALRWASDPFPGSLAVSIVDAAGQEHRIVEKVSVLTIREVTNAIPLLTELWIPAEMEHIDGGRVSITFKHDTETRSGLKRLLLEADDVRWI
ncbi:hypothetical protein [Salinispora fenicalii]|uniref:hypothetical protein n=1 Tax=Salinispora fenicalii TaxID=1137263 RepID=UPI0004AE63E4|nr:hypothetical protein [Salinispora fenicalii]